MSLYEPDSIPDPLEIEAVAAKMIALGLTVTPEHLAAIAGMTRKEIAEFIKSQIR